MLSEVGLNNFGWGGGDLDMFVWTSGFQNPLAHIYFNTFVDEC